MDFPEPDGPLRAVIVPGSMRALRESGAIVARPGRFDAQLGDVDGGAPQIRGQLRRGARITREQRRLIQNLKGGLTGGYTVRRSVELRTHLPQRFKHLWREHDNGEPGEKAYVAVHQP